MTIHDQRVIAALAPWADIAATVTDCMSRAGIPRIFDECTLCRAASLPGTKTIDVLELLRAMEGVGLVRETTDLHWEQVSDRSAFDHISPLLAAVSFYKRVAHEDRTLAEVVVTRPGAPSELEQALNEFGFTTGLVENTSEAFADLAASATRSLTVMTPFLDAHGGRWLANVVKKTRPGVRTTVILRHLRDRSHHAFPIGVDSLIDEISGLNVEVLDYMLYKGGGAYETFHAKVILSDDTYAYVGSANMNRASLEYSMELGVLLKGDAARRIAQILDAIRAVAKAYPL